MRALLLSAPWFILAIATVLNGEPVSARSFAALCAAMGATFLLEAWTSRVATETAYQTGVRHACEEVQREAKSRATPAEAQAVLDAAARVIRLAAKEPT